MNDQKRQSLIQALIRERRTYEQRKLGAEESLAKASDDVGRAQAERDVARATEQIGGVNDQLRRFGVNAKPDRVRAERRVPVRKARAS